ncbi:hypothetical protein, partial [Nocardioides plantarum]
PAGTATWGTSDYLASANPGRPNPLPTAYAAPSTFDETTRLSTWGTGSGLVAPDGSADLAFAGTAVNFAKTGGGWLRLADLQADLDASGNGTVSALVSYGTSVTGTPGDLTYDPQQAPDRGPTRVDLVTLAGNTAADRVTTPTSAAWTDLDGTWTTAFTTFLAGDATATPAVPAWSYATTVTNATTNPANGTTYNPTRTAESFSFAVDTVVPATTATITSATPSGGVVVAASGTGFRGVTNPGDAGVYIGIAPSGGLPDVSTVEGMDAFAAADYRPTASLATGSWSSTLTAPTDKLDPTRTYSVYTWQAHSHSNTSQDTETPLDIDFADLVPQETTTTATGATTRVYGTATTLTAAVDAPGSVTLTGVGASQTRPVVDGVATFTVPARLAVGSYVATLAYAGNGDHLPSRTTRSLEVTKARPTLALTVTTRPTSGPPAKAGKASVVVTGPKAVAAPAGTVTLRITRPGALTRTVKGTLKYGKLSIAVPKVGKGRWTLTASYPGSASFGSATKARTVLVR